jgi:hypothetical protein
MSRLACFALLVVAAFSLLGDSTAAAWCRLSTDMPPAGQTCATSGIGLAWQRQCLSFTMMNRARTSPPLEDVRNTGDASFQTWEQVMCGAQPVGLQIAQTQQLGMCDAPEFNTRAPNANTIIFIEDWAARELPADAFGLTLVWHNPDTGEIYDADMQINETIGPITLCSGVCPLGAVDLQNVMTHEAGHFLGLGHSAVRSATMSARATIGETSKRTLDDDDVAGLCAIYGDFSPASCSSADFTPNHGFSAQCADPKNAGAGSGRSSTSSSSSSSKTTLGCSAANVHAAPAYASLGWLVAFGWLRQRRLRSRVAKSSSIPSPTSK